MRPLLFLWLLAGCTLYDSRSDGGDDDGGGGNNPPPAGPVDRSFFLERMTIVDDLDCPAFPQQNGAHAVEVLSDTVLVDGFAATGVVVRSPAARQSAGDSPNLVFTARETWDNGTQTFAPDVVYQVWVDGPLVTGEADTTFAGGACSFSWNVSG